MSMFCFHCQEAAGNIGCTVKGVYGKGMPLLSLGVKNIHLGPTLPAFLSPGVAKVLADSFGLAGITTVGEDTKSLTAQERSVHRSLRERVHRVGRERIHRLHRLHR